MNRQDIWALPTSMESFGICVGGLASSVHLLVHPSAITPADLMDLFGQNGEFDEVYDCRVSVTSLVEVYEDKITAHFTRMSKCALRTDSEQPPRVSVVTSKLRMVLKQLVESTWKRVSRYIIPDNERMHTGSHYKEEQGMDMLGKHKALVKAIKALTDKVPDDKSYSHEEEQ